MDITVTLTPLNEFQLDHQQACRNAALALALRYCKNGDHRLFPIIAKLAEPGALNGQLEALLSGYELLYKQVQAAWNSLTSEQRAIVLGQVARQSVVELGELLRKRQVSGMHQMPFNQLHRKLQQVLIACWEGTGFEPAFCAVLCSGDLRLVQYLDGSEED